MNSIELSLNVRELYKLNKFIHGIILKKDPKIDLIVEEIFVNIVNYSNSEFVNVNVKYENQTIYIEFIDNGSKFNPLIKENPKTPKSIKDAPVGGLGIFLTKQIADDLSYKYVNGKNHLKIIKKVE